MRDIITSTGASLFAAAMIVAQAAMGGDAEAARPRAPVAAAPAAAHVAAR